MEYLSASWNIEDSINQGVICTCLCRQTFGIMYVCPDNRPQFRKSGIGGSTVIHSGEKRRRSGNTY